MSVRAPLREAADSMAKARTPEPFSASKTSNWVARAGGLPPYIQHIAHDLIEKRGKTESEAIGMAVGIVKRWARGGGNVDATTRAAAALAVKQWEEKKAKAHVSEARPWEVRRAEGWLREDALGRLAVLESKVGHEGMLALVDGSALLESAMRGMDAGEDDSPEAAAVEQLGEMARWDLITVSCLVPGLAGLVEAAALVPLAEGFSTRELRDFRGRWERGGSHPPSMGALLTPPRSGGPVGTPGAPRAFAAHVPSQPHRPRRPRNPAEQSYEAGRVRVKPTQLAVKDRSPLKVEHDESLKGVAGREDKAVGRRATTAILKGGHSGTGPFTREHPDTQNFHAERDASGAIVHNEHGGVVYSAERTQLHARIIESLLAGKPHQEGAFGPEAIFTAGGPASGKSSLIKAGLVRVPGRRPGGELGQDHAVHINPDIIRKMLPEYHQLSAAGREEEAAGFTHEESSDLAKTLTRIAMQRNHHILVDGVGDSGAGKFAGKIQRAQAAGYRTSVTYADTGIREAIARADERGRKSGRHVDHGTVVSNHVGVAKRFAEVEQLPHVHVRVFDTSGPPGTVPRPMAEKLPHGERTAILDPAGMERFRSKGRLDPGEEHRRLVAAGVAKG